MSEGIKEKILGALFFALKPIVRALLRSGIGFREFSEVSKKAFVTIATNEYGLRGRPTNISRVSVMTGLTRKEVKRLRETDVLLDASKISKSAPADILHYWFTDPEYLDELGKPKVLKYDSAPNSFCELAKKCAGDIPPGALRTELKRIGAIVERDSGLQAVKRYFIPGDVDEKLELGLRLGLAPLASTIAFNCDPKRQGPARFQRISGSDYIDRDDLLKVQESLSGQLNEFIINIDRQFSDIEVSKNTADDSSICQVGVGVYFYTEG